MEQQNDFFHASSPVNPKLRLQSASNAIAWPAAGSNMARDGSKNSTYSQDSAYYSATTESSNNSYFRGHSPAAPSFSDDNGSPIFYDHERLPILQNLQSTYSESSSTEYPHLGGSYPSRSTFSSLNWGPYDEDFLKSYKFVISKGKEPHFELNVAYVGASYLPEKVYLDPPLIPKKGEYPCLYPGGCDDKVFKRPADLERHYRNVHGTADQKDNFRCDYHDLCKSRPPFTRKDHFRDHLREYHKEDIGNKVRSTKNKSNDRNWLKLQAAWIEERKIEVGWWRCPRCLQRVQIDQSAYFCQTCKHPCDQERMERIERVRAVKLQNSFTTAPVTSRDAELGNIDYGYSDQLSAAATTTNFSNVCVVCGAVAYALEPWNDCLSCQAVGNSSYYAAENWDDGNYDNDNTY